MNYNRVILAGYTTRDPTLTFLPSQTPVVEFGLAVNRKWKDKDGNKKEDVCFVDLKAFGRTAEILNQYTKKGSQILVEGRLHFESWEKDGTKHSKLRVIVENFQFIGKKEPQAEKPYEQKADEPYDAAADEDPLIPF